MLNNYLRHASQNSLINGSQLSGIKHLKRAFPFLPFQIPCLYALEAEYSLEI